MLIEVVSAINLSQSLTFMCETHEYIATTIIAIRFVELELGPLARGLRIESGCTRRILPLLHLVVLLLEELACTLFLLSHVAQLHLVLLAQLGRCLANAIVYNGRVFV